MDNPDDRLQAYLDALEQGKAVEQVLAGIPADDQDLIPLIKLAAATRSMRHPQLSPAVAWAQQARLMNALPARKPRHSIWTWLENWHIPPALAGGLALCAVLIVAAVVLNLFIASPAAAQSARLADVNGLVEVASSPDSSDWHFVSSGEMLRPGERIRSYADSSAVLVYYEGSRTRIGPDSDLTLTTLDGGGSALKVLLTQYRGDTTHDVIPLRGNGSFFEVNTPAGRVSVHGTSFDVAVDSEGEATFAVTHGKVQVKNERTEVFLTSGQMTSALPGENMDDPAYQLTLRGAIDQMSSTRWVVNGVTVSITPETRILGTYQPGDFVFVHGRILAGGVWTADRIEPARNDIEKSSFTGMIDTLGGVPGVWQIGGQNILVDPTAELSLGLAKGSAVEVSFVVMTNGSWLAKSIESLEQERPTATPTTTRTTTRTGSPSATYTATGTPATRTSTATATATYTGTPHTSTPTPTLTLTVVPKNDSARCDNRTQQPEALQLAQRYGITYDEIMTWFCKGFGFGEIDLAYSLSQSSGKPVSDIFSLRSSGEGWGNIKKMLSSQVAPMPPNGNNNNKSGKTPGPKNK